MRKLLSTLMCVVLSTVPAALAQSTAAGTVEARVTKADTLDFELARLHGSNLSFTECQSRMTAMEPMLSAAGYGRRLNHGMTDGSVFTRWYDPLQNRTVVAISMPSDDGRGYGFDAYAVAGQVHWTEYLPMP